MLPFYQKLSFVLVFLCLFTNFSYGVSKAEQEEKVVKTPDSPPQITITLRSDFIFEQPLEPDPQKNISDENVQFTGKKKKEIVDRKKPTLSNFKTDKGYQSIERFERISPKTFEMSFGEKSKLSKKRIRKTVNLRDKSLILGGRGFNIETFNKPSDLVLGLDYTAHLREQAQYIPPNIPPIELDHSDPDREYSKHIKDLIYGETRIAFDKMPPPLTKSHTVESQAQVPIPVEKNPNSVLVLSPGKDSIAVVPRDEKLLDLLAGNETLNKKRFHSE